LLPLLHLLTGLHLLNELADILLLSFAVIDDKLALLDRRFGGTVGMTANKIR
jgi:hypothetical protein